MEYLWSKLSMCTITQSKQIEDFTDSSLTSLLCVSSEQNYSYGKTWEVADKKTVIWIIFEMAKLVGWKATLKLDNQAKRNVTSENTHVGNLGNQWWKAFLVVKVGDLLPLCYHFFTGLTTSIPYLEEVHGVNFQYEFFRQTSLYKSHHIHCKPEKERFHFPQVWWSSSRWRHGASIGKVSENKTWTGSPDE